MPYTHTQILSTQIDGRTYQVWQIDERDTATTAEWVVDALPPLFTITLYECAILGTTTDTLDPELGTALGWTSGTINAVAENETPAASLRTSCNLRVTSPNGLLVGRSKASASGHRIITRITIMEGH